MTFYCGVVVVGLLAPIVATELTSPAAPFGIFNVLTNLGVPSTVGRAVWLEVPLVIGAVAFGLTAGFVAPRGTGTGTLVGLVALYGLVPFVGLAFAPIPLPWTAWVGPLLAALGGSVAAGSLLVWRRRRWWPVGCCQTCGYDLQGSESGLCPECGTARAQDVEHFPS